MITLHFHLIPQYKYELFHIHFTWFHCTGRYELNKLTLLPMCGFIAQLVEHRTGIAEVMGSNPVEALIFFFRLLLSNWLNWKIYCDDHTSLSSNTAVQIWIISYTFHICFLGTLLLYYILKVLMTSYQLPWQHPRSTKRPLNVSFCKISEKLIRWRTVFISLLKSSLNYLPFQAVWKKFIKWNLIYLKKRALWLAENSTR